MTHDTTQASPEPSEPPKPPTLSRGPVFPLPLWPACGLAVLSGLLYFAAFPGLDIWPLAFCALAPLLLALRGQSTRRATLLGWLAGFTMVMSGFYWLLNMLREFSSFHWLLCLLLMSLLCAYQAGRVGFLGWLYGRATHRGWPAVPVFILAFITSELVFPLLFPWFYGATVHQVPALIQVAELGSPILVAVTLLPGNIAVAELVRARLERRAVPWKKLALLAAVPAASACYGALRIHQVDAQVASATPARFGLVQANISLRAKRQQRELALVKHLQLSQQLLREQGPLDLIVWPESAVTAARYENQAKAFYKRHVASQIGAPAIFGAVLVRPVQDARRHVFFNVALGSDELGNIQSRYDKQFLLMFGEYLPLGDTFPQLYEYSPRSGRFTRGTSQQPLRIKGREIATFICYEDIVPSFVNGIMNHGQGPQLLVNLTNDAWFGDTTEPWIHLALAKFRSVEQRRFLVRATNSGVSAVVDPVGRVVAHTGTFVEGTIAADGAWMTGRTPYRFYGDSPYWLASLALALACFIPRPRRAKRHPPSTSSHASGSDD